MDRPALRKQLLGLLFFFAVTAAAAVVGGLSTGRSVEVWYPGLEKPPGTPPGWLFGPVWTLLYTMMAVAAWMVWRSAPWPSTRTALVFYSTKLVFNAGWSIVFFGLQAPGAALVVIVVLLVLIGLTAWRFYRHVRAAGWLMVPYFAWVLFATYLNAGVWWLN